MLKEMNDILVKSSKKAVFKDKYRYFLSREWDKNKPKLLYIMLNPSTADDIDEDKSITQCFYFAYIFGYGSFEVVNLYSYKSTDPSILKRIHDPIGCDTNKYILNAASKADKIVSRPVS
jgi:hypothetical protein